MTQQPNDPLPPIESDKVSGPGLVMLWAKRGEDTYLGELDSCHVGVETRDRYLRLFAAASGLLSLLSEAVELFELLDICSDTGGDHWVWLVNARTTITAATQPTEPSK